MSSPTAGPDIIWWQPVLTDHQSYTLSALQERSGAALAVYVRSAEDPTRRAQGWVNRHTTPVSVRQLPAHGALLTARRVLRGHPRAIHIFGSPFDSPVLILTLVLALLMKRSVYLVSEPYSPISVGYLDDAHRYVGAIKGWLRPAVYRCYGFLIGRRIAGVFAISPLAAAQYERIGVPAERIFPFGYFVPRLQAADDSEAAPRSAEHDELRVVFVGALIHRKGLDILIEATRNLLRQGASVTLDVYGPGQTSAFAFDDHDVRYRGVIPFGAAQATIARYDVLVLPSRYDGWGVVVNEAILAGVPVVCSDRVGAGSLVQRWGCGSIFASGNTSDLEAKLFALASDAARMDECRTAARTASEAIESGAAAEYMLNVLRQRPACASW